MDYSKCSFYNMKSKKKLFDLLYIKDDVSYNFLINNYKVFLKNGDRLVETPIQKLLVVHKRIKQLLDYSIVGQLPNYIICKKKSSWMEVGNYHKSSNSIASIDISKFFPSVTYIMIYDLFIKKFKTSKIVAEILTNIITVNHDNLLLSKEINNFIENINSTRKVKIENIHLPTGSPVSVLLAELVCLDMYKIIRNYCNEKSIVFTVYVDDITLSSMYCVNYHNIQRVIKIVHYFGFEINTNKTRRYNCDKSDSLLTGLVKKKRSTILTPKYDFENKLKKDIHSEFTDDILLKIRSRLCIIKYTNKKMYNYYSKLLNEKSSNI
ncbi:MAG: reverse transcriptase domain-containing protein [Peptostreptococcaceae bacterium]